MMMMMMMIFKCSRTYYAGCFIVFFFKVFMPPPPIGIGGDIMFSGCPSVSACVRPGVLKVKFVSTISYKPMDGISPNFG